MTFSDSYFEPEVYVIDITMDIQPFWGSYLKDYLPISDIESVFALTIQCVSCRQQNVKFNFSNLFCHPVSLGEFVPLPLREFIVMECYAFFFVEVLCDCEVCIVLRYPISILLLKLILSLYNFQAFIYLWSCVLLLQIWIKVWLGKMFLVKHSFCWFFSLYPNTTFWPEGCLW